MPDCITAGTGFVGVRCPAHPATRQLLSLAGVPVAAPSANRFGHVRYSNGPSTVPVARNSACESLGTDGDNQQWQYAE